MQILSSFGRGTPAQIFSKFTWELPQQLVGVAGGHYHVFTGNVDKITHQGGATVLHTTDPLSGLYTIGSVITGQKGTIRPDFGHEYGHYVQSRMVGPGYGFVGGWSLYSAATKTPTGHRKTWTEIWADELGKGQVLNTR